MPPVCKFFLKGYCRYGRNCRFEHPGENTPSNSGFSFTKALQDTHSPQQPTVSSPVSGFSFTRALESTTSTSHHFGHQSTFGAPILTQQPSSNNYFSTPIVQRPPDNLSFGGFSFVKQAAAVSAVAPQVPAPSFTNSFTSLNNSGIFNNTSQIQHNSTIFASPPNDIDMRPPPSVDADENFNIEIQQLTEAELKAYRGDRFQFRQIPVRPPPDSLCA